MSSIAGSTAQRRRINTQGNVQGVGFRPFVFGLARRFGLAGFVLNDSQGVIIEVEGTIAALDDFTRALRAETPPLARIDSLSSETIPAHHENAFTIAHSQRGAERQALIVPDAATCADCLRELCDSTDRRSRYPFINCTNCGPRFTIVQDVPYDRDKTTMRGFTMCPMCQAEYDDPGNRRFHAQPNACPDCGPQVQFLDWGNIAHEYADPIGTTAQRLTNGEILAIKGLGGYHLACDALNENAVRRLRQRKHREAKPFALMAPDLEAVKHLCLVSEREAALLQSHRRPIVLLAKRPGCPVASDVAPHGNTLGMMLPYTPVHQLLLAEISELVGAERPAILVMTSGNLSDEPIAYRDEDARQRLVTIAGGALLHNREIHMRCDDSVTRVVAGGEQIFRRSRGYVPEPVLLARALPVPLLATGGHLKNTFCLGKGTRAFLSHHIGDLENVETLTSFHEGIAHFQRLFDIYPEAIAYDLHPEYLATKYALDAPLAQKIGVQHHHAHIASVLAEHGLRERVIGVAADGTGYGTDGAVWGCEVMAADLTSFERLAHLSYLPMPGGEHAVRQTWRMAATYLARTFGEEFTDLDIPFVRRLDRSKWHVLSQMMAKQLNSPRTSSLGRLFDAVAALLGVRDEVLFEGQAAIELEVLAQSAQGDASTVEAYPVSIEIGEGQRPAQLDVRPAMRAMVSELQAGVAAREIALRFHHTIAEMLAVACFVARESTGLETVALSGGVFQNRLLLEELIARLEGKAFRVLINRRVPPNDGGLSLGQLAVAAARLDALS